MPLPKSLEGLFLIAMHMKDNSDTIAAISTPKGIGALAIVRLSGKSAISIADQVFCGKKNLFEIEPQRAAYGKIIAMPHKTESSDCLSANQNIEVVDEVVVIVFKSPNSYTGEDIVEITCHGGFYISEQILTLLMVKVPL